MTKTMSNNCICMQSVHFNPDNLEKRCANCGRKGCNPHANANRMCTSVYFCIINILLMLYCPLHSAIKKHDFMLLPELRGILSDDRLRKVNSAQAINFCSDVTAQYWTSSFKKKTHLVSYTYLATMICWHWQTLFNLGEYNIIIFYLIQQTANILQHKE